MTQMIKKERTREIAVEDHGNSRHIIFNRPETLNCMYLSLLHDTVQELRKVERNYQRKLVVIRSYGHKVFSAGANIKKITEALKSGGDDASVIRIGTNYFYALSHLLGNMKNPVVVVLDGLSMGGGAMVPSVAPFRIATENTVFSMPETKIGSFVDAGASYTLSRMDRQVGLYIALTGTRLMAEDALYCGLATHFVLAKNLDAMLESLSKLENPTHDMINETIEEYMVPSDHKPLSHTLTASTMSIIERCFKYDSVLEIVRALQEDGSKFALKTLKEMSTASPRSLSITIESIRTGTKRSFLDCLKTERYLWTMIPYDPEFNEGVSAFLTKRKPNWEPSRIEDVDIENDVRNKFFKNSSEDREHDDIWNIYDNFPSDHEPINNRYVLPSQKTIIAKLNSLNQDKQSTLEWFLKSSNNKYGMRQRVEDVLGMTDQQAHQTIEVIAKL